MKSLEKLTREIFEEFKKDGEPVTMDEAREIAEAEIKSKENCKNYVQTEKKKERKPRPPKEVPPDIEKIMLDLIEAMESKRYEVKRTKNQAIDFGEYTLTLTKHRVKKEK